MLWWLRIKLIYCLSLLRRNKVEAEIDDELDFHLQMRIREYQSNGLSYDEAKRDAIQRFGNVYRITEQSRYIRGGNSMENLFQDLRYAVRMLAKQPALTIIAIITLAFGIGANTAIFSVVSSVLLRPLPYHQSENLVLLQRFEKTKKEIITTVSYVDFNDWKEQSQAFNDMATFRRWGFRYQNNDEIQVLNVAAVSSNFFQLLDVNPLKGRLFLKEEEDPGGNKTVLLSYAFWQKMFGGDEKIVSRQIKLDDEPFNVIGILRPDFKFPFGLEKSDVWVTNAVIPRGMIVSRNFGNFLIIGRLKPATSLQSAQTEMDGIADRIQKENPIAHRDIGVVLFNMQRELTKDVRKILWILFGAVALVLMIACSNVANILLARAASRQKEIAIRAALGASAARLVRQMLTESILLSLAGAVSGLFLAAWGVKLLLSISPASLPRINVIGIDGSVLAFTLITATLTGILFGLVPALKFARPDLYTALKDGGKTSGVSAGRSWLNGVLVVGEISFAFVLLIGAGLLINSFIRLTNVDLGYQPKNLLTVGLSFSSKKYSSPASIPAFLDDLKRQITRLPGVKGVGFSVAAPFGGGVTGNVRIRGHEWLDKSTEPSIGVVPVTEDYFNVMGTRLLQGRSFTETDDINSGGAVIINEKFARLFLVNENPLGQVITDFGNKSLIKQAPKEYVIVGVVANVRSIALDEDPLPVLYLPYRQGPWDWGELVIRTDGNNATLIPSIRREINNADPSMGHLDFDTIEKRISDSIIPQKFNLLLLTIFAGIGVVLAAVGIYGVMYHRVIGSVHEIGVRMALGAQSRDVLGAILRQGLLLTIIGLGIGVLASLWLTRLMESLLYGITPTDSLTFASVAFTFVMIALLACYIPARRATKVDPMTALRYE